MYKIGEIIFHGSTYEVEIKGKKSAWPFLRLDDNGQLLDSFCSCQGPCSHIKEAYKAIFLEKPLHMLYKESFFRELGLIFFKRWGAGTDLNPKSLKGIGLSLRPKNNSAKKKLKEIFQKKKEDEHSSLKFSRLSPEELDSYKEARASLKIQYELSLWSDLAKWLFLTQDKLKITFKGNPLPLKLEISSAGLDLEILLKAEELQSLIPLLTTVKSTFKVFKDKKIEKAIFDEKKAELQIIFERKTGKRPEGAKIGPWIFVSKNQKDAHKKGFYLEEKEPFLEKLILQKKEIAEYLSANVSALSPFFKISLKAKEIQKTLFIDENQNLHIESYLKTKKDLKAEHVFYPWAFLKDKNQTLQKLKEKPTFKLIEKEKVGEFVSENRLFLQNIEGFAIHFGSFQERLLFKISKEGNLQFVRKLKVPQEFKKVIDYGAWVYVEGKGFYGKKGLNIPALPEMVEKTEIAYFLNKKSKDLDQINGFFLDENPLEKVGLKIGLNEKNRIVIEQKIIPRKGVKLEEIEFFEPFVYLKNQGFFKLPPHLRLPEEYREKKELPLSKESFFVHYELERLKKFILEIDPRLVRPEKLSLKLTKLKKSGRSYLAELIYSSRSGEVNALQFWQALSEKKEYIFSEAGLVFLRGYRFKWLSAINPKRILKKQGLIRVKIWEWIKLTILENIKRPIGKKAQIKKMQKLFDELSNMGGESQIDLGYLKSTLRPYQEIGVKWLNFLYEEGLSGFLCDEMGLGKTHQAMGILATALKKDEKRENKYLVVCPTSVIYHWENLLKRFLPEMKVCIFHGLGRSLKPEAELILTSYGLARSEKKLFENLEFEIAIFDEIQIAKNKSSKIHKALSEISAEMYLALTGTPVENRLEELKALFDLILPGYFPGDSAFKELFIEPIEKENDEKKKKLLKKLVRPFVMRRRKKEVLKDLPEKTEEIAYADLLKEQRELYLELLSLQKNKIIQELKDKSCKKAYLHVFALLTKLKQLCDHPSLIEPELAHASSGKWELFKELLAEALDSEQKVVVFSQYLGMIKIIKDYLKEKNIKYASITGSTQKRFEEIKKFQEDPECMVFVGSLLASGTGIDLTAGSVVIHYDRWWNPAKENQATDRVHRIGQNRGVQVFKLITKNTIEERIHTLIEKKKMLIEETIGADEKDQLKGLSREELIGLLEDLDV